MEDELYVKGNTVIWSRGIYNKCDSLPDNGRKIMCAFTSSLPIKHAIWCTFHCEHPTYESDLLQYDKEGAPNGTPMPSLCIIDGQNIKVFSEKGEDFITAIPFQIEKVWATRYGIFIEKQEGTLILRMRVVFFLIVIIFNRF